MSELFVTILNMSFTASIVASVVIVIRILLRKAPKVFSYLLWIPVIFRLVCPVSFESGLSLMPAKPAQGEQTYSAEAAFADSLRVYTRPEEQRPVFRGINSGLPMIDEPLNMIIDRSAPAPTPQNSIDPISPIDVLAWLWLSGFALASAYAFFGYIRLKRRLDGAILLQGNIWESSIIAAPFVLGFFKPRIYIPSAMPAERLNCILLHEQTHIRRFDHIIKPVAFLAVCLHWFNPLMWYCYSLMTKDMEMSCDEAVLRVSAHDMRIDYSNALLALSVNKSSAVAPLAFGETGVKSRIKNILSYRRPALSVSLVSLAAIAVACIFLITNGRTERQQNEYDRLYSMKTAYVGDNSKVGGILELLPVPDERLKKDIFEIDSSEQPYKLTVKYKPVDTANPYDTTTDTAAENIRTKNALMLFGLIGNLEVVDFYEDYSEVNSDTLASESYFSRIDFARFGDPAKLWEGDRSKLLSALAYLDKYPDNRFPLADYPYDRRMLRESYTFEIPESLYKYSYRDDFGDGFSLWKENEMIAGVGVSEYPESYNHRVLLESEGLSGFSGQATRRLYSCDSSPFSETAELHDELRITLENNGLWYDFWLDLRYGKEDDLMALAQSVVFDKPSAAAEDKPVSEERDATEAPQDIIGRPEYTEDEALIVSFLQSLFSGYLIKDFNSESAIGEDMSAMILETGAYRGRIYSASPYGDKIFTLDQIKENIADIFGEAMLSKLDYGYLDKITEKQTDGTYKTGMYPNSAPSVWLRYVLHGSEKQPDGSYKCLVSLIDYNAYIQAYGKDGRPFVPDKIAKINTDDSQYTRELAINALESDILENPDSYLVLELVFKLDGEHITFLSAGIKPFA